MSESITYSAGQLPGLIGLSCSSDFHFANHIHNGHVIWLNSSGGERFSLRGNTEILQPGEISIIEPGVVHSNSPCEGSDRFLRSLYLESPFWEYLERMFCGTVDWKFNLPTIMLKEKVLWKKLLLLHQAVISRQDVMVIEDIAVTLFFDLCVAANTSNLPVDVNIDTPKGRELGLVIDYMNANLSEPLSLNDLATIADCTSYHLIRLFKKHLGMSPHAYLIQLRLERARQFLDTKNSIVDAAILSGFSDQSHLTRKFRSRYGITPGKYVDNIW